MGPGLFINVLRVRPVGLVRLVVTETLLKVLKRDYLWKLCNDIVLRACILIPIDLTCL